jgi:hypothetical protein
VFVLIAAKNLREGPEMPRTIAPASTYTDKLVKLIPAEWVGAYIAIKGILDSAPGVPHAMYYGTTLVLLLLLPAYLRCVLAVKSNVQIFVTTVSLGVWVFSLGGDYVGALSWYEPYQGSILLILWTLIIPILIGKRSRPSGRGRSQAAAG